MDLTRTVKQVVLEIKDMITGVTFDTVSAGWYARNGYAQIAAILSGGLPAQSGETVSMEAALGNSVVYACNKIVSEMIGMTPAIVKQRKGDDTREATELPVYNKMLNAPNAEISAHAFTELLTSHTLLDGNGFAHIQRRSGPNPTCIGLTHLLPEQVIVDREKQGQKRLVYTIKNPGERDKDYTVIEGKPQDILHIRGLGWDGKRGYSVIQVGRQSIGNALGETRHYARFLASGGRIPYLLELMNNWRSGDDAQKFRDDWEQKYSMPGRAPMLPPGVTYKQTGLSMKDSQMIEAREYMIAEICRWFGVSPHLVFDLSRATFSNIEHLFLQFKVLTLASWYSRWEQDFWRCVLTPAEQEAGYFLHHNDRALLRGDFKTMMEGYASALLNGHWNIDEVRQDQQMNKLKKGAGETYRVPLNVQTVPGTGEPSLTEQRLLQRSQQPSSNNPTAAASQTGASA